MSTDLQKQQPLALQPTSMLEAVMRAVRDPDVDTAKLRELLEIGERLEARRAKQQFDAAMVELQAELPIIQKDGLIVYPGKDGKRGGSTAFAKWDDIHRACMPLLRKHGFTCSFSSDLVPPNALRVSIKVKGYGHEDEGALTVPWLDQGGSKSPAQQAASSETLAMRHVFVKYFNILTQDQDDDGSGKGVPERITEEQVRRIEDILMAIEEKEKGARARFSKWLKAEMQADAIGDLFQGEQLKAVMQQLSNKMATLGIR